MSTRLPARPARTDLVSELATRLGFSQRRLSIAVQMAESLIKEEVALVEALLQFEAAEGDVDRRRRVAESLREVVEQYRDEPKADPLADVDEAMSAGEAAAAVLWADLETRTNRAQMLRDCVSAEEAGRLTGRSRQAIEKQRREGRALALRAGRLWRYPVWQFDADSPGGLVPGLREVLSHLHMSPVGAALWLTTSRQELDGETPIQRLQARRSDGVVKLAEQQGFLP